MKFIVSSSLLSKKLQVIAGVLNTSNTLPILDDFLFEVDNNELTISASDLETTMTAKVDIESKDSGSIAIPARLLLDTLKTFPEQPLTFLIDNEKLGIEISSDYGKYKLTGHNGDEFPKIPKVEGGDSVEISAAILLRALSKTIFATGNDELRPVMNGVLCELSTESLTFVATDAHKLVKYRRTDAKASKSASFIIPKKPLSLLKNVLPVDDEDAMVSMQYNDSNILIYPEGVPGIGKGFNNKYQLQRFSTSFIRMAIKYKTDIIPISTINAEYINPWSYNIGWITKLVNKIGMPFFKLKFGLMT